jgi:hypothetical protein
MEQKGIHSIGQEAMGIIRLDWNSFDANFDCNNLVCSRCLAISLQILGSFCEWLEEQV